MTTRYQKEHYEDVADVLLNTNPVMRFDPPYSVRDSLQRATIVALIQGFADLFTADNPPVCGYCGRSDGGDCWESPDHTHDSYVGGFNREQFLVACGLESEG